ncbi:MAG: ParA family protein [Clostridia bacterium]|nr:ParA family protein [Clostridia bacterium]MBQ7086965.1 ParA family protein [Clostridia bacterium]
MAKIIAVTNQKGGVGKTTSAVNISAGLALMGRKVLLVDIDPQGNSSSGFGVEAAPNKSVYDVLMGNATVKEARVRTKWCDVLPTDNNLAGAEIELVATEGREYILKNALDKVRDEYDYIFIDCPPSLALLTLNALVACDTVLVPMQCEYYALEGLSQLTHTIRTVKRSMNKNIDFEGILLTMYDGRTNLTIQVAEEIKKFFGPKVYKTVIPRNVRLSEAPSHGLPIFAYDRLSRGAESYGNVCKEIDEKNRRG